MSDQYFADLLAKVENELIYVSKIHIIIYQSTQYYYELIIISLFFFI